MGAVLNRELCSRGKLAHSLEYREGGRRVAIAQKKIERSWIDLGLVLHRFANGPHLGAEIQTPVFHSVVQQLDAHRVAGKEHPLAPYVPDRQAKHAVQPVQNFVAPLLISVDNDFCVRFRRENVSVAFQFFLQFGKVIDLAIENNPD